MCTDGAPQNESFLAKVREKNPDMIANHCFLHREVLVAKTVPDNLKKVLNTSQVCLEQESLKATGLNNATVCCSGRHQTI